SKAVDDFKREAEVLAQLEHPSIPTIYDYFIESGRYYLVMKWIGGGDLAEQMRQRGGTVDEGTVAKWAIQICDVLHYIHSQKPPIIYRDLKPANLMLDDRSGRVMLVDFGIARIVRPTEKGVTAIGTMGYAPPELFAGKVEPRSDIYSLGATMFHMMTGSDPQDNPLLIFDFTKNPRPSQINASISPGMERILMKSVAHRPEDRHGSALDLMRSLEDHMARLGGKSAPSSVSRAGTSSPGSRQVPQPQLPPPVQGPPPPSRQVAAVDQTPQSDWVFCGHCGQRIAVDDVFCPHCGSRQPLGGQAGQATPNLLGRATAQLVVVGKSDIARPFRIEKDSILIGRTDPHTGIFPEVDLTMYDPETKVSRKHARIYREGEQFLIEDLSSVNGTIINPVRGGSIRLDPKRPHVLNEGDMVRLGETVLKFVMV
ncbi:MAG: protein kinase domain-containing protein, partial [Blastocatellia bacterium]